MNLLDAHDQWKSRPADETYWGINDALQVATYIKASSREIAGIPYGLMSVVAENGEVVLTTGLMEYGLTHCAAQQLCVRANVPHSFISKQPALLAAQNLQWGLRERLSKEKSSNCELLVYGGREERVRAITSNRYERLWNQDFLTDIQDLVVGREGEDQWRTPPARPTSLRQSDPRQRPATAEDIRGIEGLTSIRAGDIISPAGCYLSDHDMFVFLVSGRVIQGPSGPLCRFAMFWNNEIGTGSWGATFGYFDHVCGNHIIWNATAVTEFRVRHIGAGKQVRAMRDLKSGLRTYLDSMTTREEVQLSYAKNKILGRDREEVVETVTSWARVKRINELTGERVGKAHDIVSTTTDRYGDPNTVWAIMSGLTEINRGASYGGERMALDRAAARLMEMV